MTDVHSPSQRSYNMSRIRGRDTSPEKIVRSLLRAEGVRYRSNAENLPGKPDIVLPGSRIAILVHGCFWHRHKNCNFTTNPKTNSEFWEKKFARTVVRDRENVRALKKLGWKVLVIWECNINKSSAAVRRKILTALRPSRQISSESPSRDRLDPLEKICCR
jgi:DNA mismatch endonuclease, patch repair protein